MKKAFVLGAGLGERLRPLTAQLPKPLVPVFHKPLITYAFDHLRALGVDDFVINTHHLPRAYDDAFPKGEYEGASVQMRFEPIRLETAGGIENVRDLLGDDDSFFVYNGDILTNLPLEPAIAQHVARGSIITLILRSQGPALHIAYDGGQGVVTDIRNQLGSGDPGTHLFTGIYIVSPEFYQFLTPGKVESVIPIFLDLIRQGRRIDAVVADDGYWWDLGSRGAYLAAHHDLQSALPAIDPASEVAASATLVGLNVVGPGAVVEAGAVLRDCILWPRARVAAGVHLERCIVRSDVVASESGVDRDY
jgi:mannose-1-phosphate guanylyltransferase